MVQVAVRGPRLLQRSSARTRRARTRSPGSSARGRAPARTARALVPHRVSAAISQSGSTASGLNECAACAWSRAPTRLPLVTESKRRVEAVVGQPGRRERVDRRERADAGRGRRQASCGARRAGPASSAPTDEEQRPLHGDVIPVDVDERVAGTQTADRERRAATKVRRATSRRGSAGRRAGSRSARAR